MGPHAPVTPLTRAGSPRAAFFPHFICRLSAVPSDVVDAFHGHACADLLERLYQNHVQLQTLGEGLTELLHAAVGREPQPAVRRRLLDARRAVFNSRPLPAQLVRVARESLPAAEFKEIAEYSALVEQRDELRRALAEARRAELASLRAGLERVMASDAIQKGLALSSPALFHAQTRFFRQTKDAAEPGARYLRIERGLLRYLTRTAMKATPFGTFCSTVPGSFGGGTGGGSRGAWEGRGDPGRQQSFVRLQKRLRPFFVERMLNRPEIRRRLYVELNPTIEIAGQEIVFLAAARHREVFRRMDLTPVLRLVHGVLAARGPLPLQELARLLSEHPDVAATREQALDFVTALAGTGLLGFRVGNQQQDVDWDLGLREICDAIDDPHARILSGALAALRGHARRFERAPGAERLAVLRDATEEFTRALALTGRPGVTLADMIPLLEDATAEASVSIPRDADLERLERSFAEWVHLTRPLAPVRAEQAAMRHFYEVHFAEEDGVPLLRFYEQLHLKHLKQHLRYGQLAAAGRHREIGGYDLENPFGLAAVNAIRKAERRIAGLLARRWAGDAGAEEISVSPEELAACLADVPAPAAEHASVSAFVQYVPRSGPDSPARLVLGKAEYHAGYGKMFSRFLYFLPDRIRLDLIEHNRRIGGGVLAEIASDDDYNANLHPPLLPREIRYPSGEGGATQNDLLPTDLVVRRHPEDGNALQLVHKGSGERVVPVDLGFLIGSLRPALYQLLARFTPPSEYRLRIPDAPATSGPRLRALGELVAAQSVVYRPRVVFDGALVLARRRWTVPSGVLPQAGGDEDHSGYFARLDRWRREHGIPGEVYVHFVPLTYRDPGGTPSGEDDEAVAGRPAPSRGVPVRAFLNLAKPQYVDFESPLFANVFGSLASRMETYVAVLEERYPPAGSLPRFGGAGHAAEQVIQLDLPARGPG